MKMISGVGQFSNGKREMTDLSEHRVEQLQSLVERASNKIANRQRFKDLEKFNRGVNLPDLAQGNSEEILHDDLKVFHSVLEVDVVDVVPLLVLRVKDPVPRRRSVRGALSVYRGLGSGGVVLRCVVLLC
jgi:hypothetical protein